jgi:hypothetical protein
MKIEGSVAPSSSNAELEARGEWTGPTVATAPLDRIEGAGAAAGAFTRPASRSAKTMANTGTSAGVTRLSKSRRPSSICASRDPPSLGRSRM